MRWCLAMGGMDKHDAVAAIEQLELAPAAIIGQSLGGHTAFLVAAERPDLVRGLVVAEASPASEGPGTAEEIRRMLSAWPAQFTSAEAAQKFFGGDTARARAWVRNLDGLRPAFEVDVMVQAIAAAAKARWDDWRRVAAPTLVIRGEEGELSEQAAVETIKAPLVGFLIVIDCSMALTVALTRIIVRIACCSPDEIFVLGYGAENPNAV